MSQEEEGGNTQKVMNNRNLPNDRNIAINMQNFSTQLNQSDSNSSQNILTLGRSKYRSLQEENKLCFGTADKQNPSSKKHGVVHIKVTTSHLLSKHTKNAKYNYAVDLFFKQISTFYFLSLIINIGGQLNM
jgi:hypothetical protein